MSSLSQPLRVGLIGTGIGRSMMPFLQAKCAEQLGWNLNYELFDTPANQGASLQAKLERLHSDGHLGVNITHPFKEQAFSLVRVEDPLVRCIAAINTVRFADGQGFNTDFSGFVRAYRHVRGTQKPGKVLLIGAGGAGRAVAFGLLQLEAEELRIIDIDFAKAEQLAQALNQAGANARAWVLEDLVAASHTDGLVNCSPLGMYQYPGNPLRGLVDGQGWAFDAVYTPLQTEFLRDAAAKALQVIHGSELAFFQAMDAFELWTGRSLQEAPLYAAFQAALQAREGQEKP